jgi:alginate O-acetyltransferase complex protein AlgI
MLFCSPEFALFFSLVFVAYWALPGRWARAGLLALSAPFFLYVTGRCLAVQSPGAWAHWLTLLRDTLAAPGFSLDWITRVQDLATSPPLALPPVHSGNYYWLAFWVAGIVAAAVGLSFRAGADRGRVWLLVLASFFFYASWNKWLALLICLSTALDYGIAHGLDAWKSPRGRKLLLAVSLCANLGLLMYFKYENFFLQSLEDALRLAGHATFLGRLQVILPIGISFYTFEAINYTVDVYRRRVRAERNLANFLLFITFFPHLVAGPIVRARDFLPQTHRPKHWDWVRVELGVRFFLMGLFKKWAIADRMAQFVDPVFGNPAPYSSGAVWLAVIAYALQIYGDFSGYSDMALGTAHMLGYKLAQNFNMPYASTNVSEFWRRWHISLSSWLRDYLFIPLGGSRCSRWRTCLNLMITMSLGGLWHGASWTFVIWGVLHGGLLVVHRYFRDFCQGRPLLDRLLRSWPGTGLRVAVTFLAVSLCWVFFRAAPTSPKLPHPLSAFQVAGTVLHHLFVKHRGLDAPLSNRGLWWTVAVVAICTVCAYSGWWRKLIVRVPAPALGFSYAVVLTLAMVLAPDSGKAFIYFQF